MKAFHFILILFCILSFLPIYSQVTTEWTKNYGGINNDEGASVQQTSDGGYIVSGSTHSFGAGNSDIWLLRTDSAGDTLWTKVFGGTGQEFGGAVKETTDNGFILTGHTSSFGAGSGDAWLIKTNSNGDTLWTKTFGGPASDGGSYVQQTSDGGFVICGTTNSFGAGNTDYWMIKTDGNGDTTWNKTYGGIYNDVAFYAQETSDGGYVIVGYRQFSGFDNSDIWLVKTDSNGDTSWTKRFGGDLNELPYSAQQTSDDGYIITGYTYSYGAGSGDVWLLKTDSNGNLLWSNTFGGVSNEAGQCVIETSDNGYIVCGFTYSFSSQGDGDVWLIKADSNGSESWKATVGTTNSEVGFSIDQTTDDGFIVCGFAESSVTYDKNVLLIRLYEGQSGIENSGSPVVSSFELKQNFPNPFNPSTTISYSIPTAGFVQLLVYDALGTEIKTLVSEFKQAGNYTINFDARNLPTGIYFYKITSGSFQSVKKMILLR